MAVPFACADHSCNGCRLVMSRAEDPEMRKPVARCFWELPAEAGGDGEDFRAEGLEWTYPFSLYDMEGEDLFTEVSRGGGLYYARPRLRDNLLDPNLIGRTTGRVVAVPLVKAPTPHQALHLTRPACSASGVRRPPVWAGQLSRAFSGGGATGCDTTVRLAPGGRRRLRLGRARAATARQVIEFAAAFAPGGCGVIESGWLERDGRYVAEVYDWIDCWFIGPLPVLAVALAKVHAGARRTPIRFSLSKRDSIPGHASGQWR